MAAERQDRSTRAAAPPAGACDAGSSVAGAPRPSEPSGVIATPGSLLVERMRRGEPAAVGALLGRFAPRLRAYFAGPCHWYPHFVPDLVQETMVRALKALPSFRGHTEAQAGRWLLGIARHVHLQQVSRQVGIRLRHQVAAELARSVPALAAAPTYLGDLYAALDELPLSQLEALRLTLEGHTIKEIAGAIEVPEGTVATRIHRARKRLRARLGRDVPPGR